MLGDITWEPLNSCKDLEALDVYLELQGAKAPQDLSRCEQAQWMMGHTPWHTQIYGVTAYVTQLKRFSMRWLDNNHQGFSQTTTSVHQGVLQKGQEATIVALKMNPEMDTSETRVLLQEAAKIFEAGLKSKTWDIHGMPQFIMTTHCEGCEMCTTYVVHIVKASELLTVEIPSREVEKAFWIVWPNVVHHIEDEASSESDKKVEWYSDRHDNLTDNVRMAENKASAEWDRRWKADEKLAQANSKITKLEAKLTELQQELTALQMQDKRMPIVWDNQ